MGRAIVTPKKQVRVGVCSVMPAHTTECFDNSEMAIPPGFLQELACDLMEDLWYALAAAKHPEAFEDEHSHLSLDELFDGCLADVTWSDFWHAFPYELREQGDCLDEIDALGLLLSTQISRSRFERHFEQLGTTSSSSNNSSSGTSQQTAALPVRLASVNRSSSSRALARAFGAAPAPQPLGDYLSSSLTALVAMNNQEAAGRGRRDDQFPLPYSPDQFLQYPPEQSWMNTVVAAAGAGASAGAGQPRQQPARRMSRHSLAVPPPSGQQQLQLQPRQQHVAYVSPAAPGRTTATTRTPGRTAGLYTGLGPGRTGQQQQQQQPQRLSQQQHHVPGTEQYSDLMDLLQQQLGTPPPLPDSPGYHWELPSVFAGAAALDPSAAEFQLQAPDQPHSSRVRSLVSTIQAALAGHATAAAGAAGAGAGPSGAGFVMQPPRTNATNANTPAPATAAAAGGGAGESAAAAGAGAFPPGSWLRAWRGMLDAGGGPGMGPPHAPMAGPPLFRAPPAAAVAAAGDPADVEEAAAAAGGSVGSGEDGGWEAQMLRRLLPHSQGGSSSSGDDGQEGTAGQAGGDRLAAAGARLPAGGEPEGFARAMRFLAHTYALSPGTAAAAEAAAAAAAAPAAGLAGTPSRQPAGAAAAPPAAGAVPAGGSQRLTGQRRTWQEACDPEGFEQERQQQQQQQQARAAPGDQASPALGAGGAAGGVGDAAAADAVGTGVGQGVVDGSSSSRQRVDYSRVWRAVHEWLTGEDEDLLELVSQVVPYSLAGRSLKTQEDTLQQLRALAGSRAVPRKVVTAVADRLYQPCPSGEAHLVRLTASSGFSKRAAAAAAVLDCCERHGMLPFYIPLAGLCTADAVEAAVMQGLFGGQQPPHTEQQTQTQQQQQAAGPGAPAGVDAGAGEAAAAAAAAAGAPGGLVAGELTLADMGVMVALMESNEAVFRPAAPPPAAAGTPPAQLRGLGLGSLGLPPSVGAAAAAAAAAGRSGPHSVSGRPSSRGGEDGDQLAAHLTLLGRCHSRQPMLLWLDEVDAAMMPDDGRPLREVLMQLLYRLPQAVVVMTSSSGLEAWRDAAVLRQVGEPLVQELTDGKLVLVEHRLPKSHLHPRCYDYIL